MRIIVLQSEQLFQSIVKRFAKADLTAQQKAEIEKIAKTHGVRIAEARKVMGLTPEQRAARNAAGNAAGKKAREDGKKGKELQAAIVAAADLTKEQIAAREAVQSLTREVAKAATAVLTPEQKEKVGIKGEGKKKNRAEKNRAEKKPAH